MGRDIAVTPTVKIEFWVPIEHSDEDNEKMFAKIESNLKKIRDFVENLLEDDTVSVEVKFN